MGTRCVVYISETEKAKPFLCIYRQCDGYLDGMGKDLLELLKGYKIVNGYSSDDSGCAVCNKPGYEHEGKHSIRDIGIDHPFVPKRVANGINCLAATIVKGLKDGLGNVYIYSPNTKDAGQEYEYRLYLVKGVLTLKIEVPGWADQNIPRKLIYSGPLDKFVPTKK